MKRYFLNWHWTTRWTACIGIICLVYIYLFAESHSVDINNSEISEIKEISEKPGRLHPSARVQEFTKEETPPLERFAAMVERPLFSPARRNVKVDAVTEEVERPEPPALPLVRFIGTIDQGGRIRALMDGPWGKRSIAVGEEVNGWQVFLVERRRLVLERGDEQLELHIFGDT